MTNGEIAVDGLRGGSARARLITGRMFSHNCFCDLDFAVTRGRLDFFYDWWERQTFSVEGAVENGNINVYIPRGSSFHVDAEAVDGDILDYFGETNERREDGPRLKATFGSGSGPSFRIRIADGDIHFEKAYEGLGVMVCTAYLATRASNFSSSRRSASAFAGKPI